LHSVADESARETFDSVLEVPGIEIIRILSIQTEEEERKEKKRKTIKSREEERRKEREAYDSNSSAKAAVSCPRVLVSS
jgi:hypothetical protein